jgi:lipopolysaccharide/colanic/teichoic acid biosynthesis glycosyltransferase
MKRAFDIAVAALGLLLLAPVFAIVAVAIKLGSRGPVFFRQERVGRGGRAFRMVKFRTMICGAEGRGPKVSGIDDNRITRVGAFLRRSFLDEAPQLFNVLAGDMSLVGPRPETPEYAALMSPRERRVLSVRPGMAGPSTLAYSVEEAAILTHHGDPDRYYREHLLHQRLAADLEYLGAVGLREDLRILLRTCAVVIHGLGPVRRRRIESAAAIER